MRTGLRALVMLMPVVAGCSESPTEPVGTRHYELVSVNGQPVPVSLPLTYEEGHFGAGDVILRDDGTFVRGVHGYLAGSFSVVGTAITLVGPSMPDDRLSRRGVIGGDSLVFEHLRGEYGYRFLFRRTFRAPPPVTAGVYTLSSVAGQGQGYGLVNQDSLRRGDGIYDGILYDSITFLDGIVYRHHRSQGSYRYYAQGDSIRQTGGSEFLLYGSYRGTSDALTFLTGSILAVRGSPYGLRWVASLENQGFYFQDPNPIVGTYTERYTRR